MAPPRRRSGRRVLRPARGSAAWLHAFCRRRQPSSSAVRLPKPPCKRRIALEEGWRPLRLTTSLSKNRIRCPFCNFFDFVANVLLKSVPPSGVFAAARKRASGRRRGRRRRCRPARGGLPRQAFRQLEALGPGRDNRRPHRRGVHARRLLQPGPQRVHVLLGWLRRAAGPGGASSGPPAGALLGCMLSADVASPPRARFVSPNPLANDGSPSRRAGGLFVSRHPYLKTGFDALSATFSTSWQTCS